MKIAFSNSLKMLRILPLIIVGAGLFGTNAYSETGYRVHEVPLSDSSNELNSSYFLGKEGFVYSIGTVTTGTPKLTLRAWNKTKLIWKKTLRLPEGSLGIQVHGMSETDRQPNFYGALVRGQDTYAMFTASQSRVRVEDAPVSGRFTLHSFRQGHLVEQHQTGPNGFRNDRIFYRARRGTLTEVTAPKGVTYFILSHVSRKNAVLSGFYGDAHYEGDPSVTEKLFLLDSSLHLNELASPIGSTVQVRVAGGVNREISSLGVSSAHGPLFILKEGGTSPRFEEISIPLSEGQLERAPHIVTRSKKIFGAERSNIDSSDSLPRFFVWTRQRGFFYFESLLPADLPLSVNVFTMNDRGDVLIMRMSSFVGINSPHLFLLQKL